MGNFERSLRNRFEVVVRARKVSKPYQVCEAPISSLAKTPIRIFILSIDI